MQPPLALDSGRRPGRPWLVADVQCGAVNEMPVSRNRLKHWRLDLGEEALVSEGRGLERAGEGAVQRSSKRAPTSAWAIPNGSPAPPRLPPPYVRAY